MSYGAENILHAELRLQNSVPASFWRLGRPISILISLRKSAAITGIMSENVARLSADCLWPDHLFECPFVPLSCERCS